MKTTGFTIGDEVVNNLGWRGRVVGFTEPHFDWPPKVLVLITASDGITEDGRRHKKLSAPRRNPMPHRADQLSHLA